ncbi:MAG: hypothetical protein AMS17_06595 [Spirochaetes bacterium DG_61]|nr:MAG: hypothetical protein AMS17_06595 [Spirochaetes bacterium DG_61]
MGDKRGFFYNLLNRPFIFNFIRSILDGGQVRYITHILNEYSFKSVLDVCCGCGAFSKVSNSTYTGIDYNEYFIRHARTKYGVKNKEFCALDIHKLEPNTQYDVSMIINSIHHFSDRETVTILRLMREFTKMMILIHDLVPQKNFISRFFYGIDRGEFIRPVRRQKELIQEAGLSIKKCFLYRTFPGIYVHSTFLCFKE